MKLIIVFSLMLGVSVFIYYIKKQNLFIDYDHFKIGDSKILFVEDKTLPYITYSVLFFNTGSNFDPKELSGLSSVTAYLLDQGAGGLSSEEIQEKLNYYGTEIQVQTGRQTTEFSLSGLARYKDELWDLFSKIIFEAEFKSKELERLKKQLTEARWSRLENPNSVASELWLKNLFKTPYLQAKAGSIFSLKKIDLKHVTDFYKNRYQQAKFVLSVTGQFDPELKKKIKKNIRQFEMNAKKQDDILVKHSKNSASYTLIKNENLVQSQIIMGYPLKTLPDKDYKTILALDVLNNILGGSRLDSKLMMELREKQALTYHVGSQFVFNKDYGYFYISGSTRTEETQTFIKEARRIVSQTRDAKISEKDVVTAKTLIRSEFMKSQETKENKLNQLVYYHFFLDLNMDFLNNYLINIDNLSLQKIEDVKKNFLHPDDFRILVYGHPKVEAQLQDKNILKQDFKEAFYEDF